jgi:hypothetical protein
MGESGRREDFDIALDEALSLPIAMRIGAVWAPELRVCIVSEEETLAAEYRREHAGP